MNGRNIAAVIVGGLVAFIWSNISWMLIPWHIATMNTFENEDAVGLAIKEASSKPGIYTYPGWSHDTEAMMKKHDAGPYVFASVVPAGVGSGITIMLIKGFLIDILGAAFLLALMLQARDRNLRVALIATLFVSLLPALAQWGWWHFPAGFTVVMILDSVIMWMLAAFVMAKIAGGGKKAA